MKFKSLVSFSILLCLCLACKTPLNVQQTQLETISISSKIPEDEEISKIIAPYKTKLDLQMNRVLAYNPYVLDKRGPNFPLGIFVTDLMLEEVEKRYTQLYPNEHIDAVLMNTGGLRRTFTPGDLTVRSIFELMPFENEIVIVTLSADKFKEMVAFLNESNKNHPIAGFSFYKGKKDLNILVKGQPFDANKTYNVVTNDYLQKGGDDMNFFKNAVNTEYLNLKIRDLFIESLGKVDTIKLNNKPRYILN